MLAFRPPSYAIAEVTGVRRFAGGRLVRTPREELTPWLSLPWHSSGARPGGPSLALSARWGPMRATARQMRAG